MVTQEQIDVVSQCFCVPVAIILNYSLFQYLLTVFYARRRDPHVRLLLIAAFLSFATLIPFSYPNEDLVRNLNDISEVCSVLTFTQQIAMLTREINRKMKMPTIARLGRVAELLVLVGMLLLVANVVHIAAPTAEGIESVELLDIIVEYTTLVFVVVFRFYFLATVRGWRTVWERQKLEVVYYLLFLTHAVPFHVAADVTGLNLHHVQGLWLRVTIALCLSSTIRAKLASMTSMDKSKGTASVGGRSGATFTVGAAGGVVDDDDDDDAAIATGPASKKLGKGATPTNSGRAVVRPASRVNGTAGSNMKAVVRVALAKKSSQTTSSTHSLKRGLSWRAGSSNKVTALPSPSAQPTKGT